MSIIKKNKLVERGTVQIKEETPLAYDREPRYAAPSSSSRESAPSVDEEHLDSLAAASREAHAEISRAKQEAARIREQARLEGREAATQKVEQEIADQMTEALETLNQAVKERQRIIQGAEGDILKLALKVAEQIIKSEVSLHRDVCLNIVSEAIARITDRDQVIIRVHRDDLEQVKGNRDRLMKIVDGIRNLSIQEDPTITPGGCVIETDLGYIDARIPTKLALIEQALQKISQ